MRCVGCGGDTEVVGARYCYDEYEKTLCVACHYVLKNVLLSKDLSEHHDEA